MLVDENKRFLISSFCLSMKLRRFKDFPLCARVSQETTYVLIESSNSNNGYDKENTRKCLCLYFVVITYACFYRVFSLT